MNYKPKLLDIGSTITIALTLILFGISVAEKGLSHELLQDAAVFLVSLKLIISMAKASQTQKEMNRHLSVIEERLALRDTDKKKAA